MGQVGFHIADPAIRMTLKVMLEAEGHQIVDGEAGLSLLISDDPVWATEQVGPDTTVLLLSNAERLPATLRAMRAGVYGYIFLPFQPGEAGLMVQRALEQQKGNSPIASHREESFRTLEDVEAEHILETLRRCKNNQAKTARVLGIGRNTLWRKLKKIETVQRVNRPDVSTS